MYEIKEHLEQDICKAAFKQFGHIPFHYSTFGDGSPATLYMICPYCFSLKTLENSRDSIGVDNSGAIGNKWGWDIINGRKFIYSGIFKCQSHLLKITYNNGKNFIEVYTEKE